VLENIKKENNLRWVVSIFTYRTFVIPVLVPPYIYSRIPGLRVFTVQ